MAEPFAIDFRNVTFAYGREPIVEDVNLSVGPREMTCIVGPNGGGKTTLLKLMLGLLRPRVGQVRILGKSPERARPHIGYMPQHIHYDPRFPVTVMDIVMMGRLRAGWGGRYSKADRAAALSALAELGIEALAPTPFAQLSGGQRQRVLIARALACEPALLLLDEPTANVDALAEGKMLDFMRELSHRMAIVMVSHDLGFVAGVVENVICVNRRVHVHPTREVTGQVIRDVYGGEVRMVGHGHHLRH